MAFNTEEFADFLKTIRQTYGFDFTNYSTASLKRRFEYFMNGKKFSDLGQLRTALLKDEELFEQFIQAISVTVTEMFRDPSFYLGLREKVLKRLATYPLIRVWVAGCATGQEAYSTAILLKEVGLLDRSVIYGTDINQHSLQIAKEGVYTSDSMKSFAANYAKAGGKKNPSDYYVEKFNMVMFNKDLRQHIVLSAHNLVADQSFNEFHLILCRNVLIYFNTELQDKVISLFHESLCPLGVLGIGSKESLHFTTRKDDFREIVPRERIYMKIK